MNDFVEGPLSELRDIYPSAAPSFWPPAPGWWLIAGLAVALVVFCSWRLRRQYQRWQRRRWVLQRVSALQVQYSETGDAQRFIAGLSELLRRVALARFKWVDVASLAGRDWLLFLDSTSDEKQFDDGVGQVLTKGLYSPGHVVEAEPLVALVRAWIKRNF